MTPTPTPTPTIEFILVQYAATLDQLAKVVADIPDARMTEQPSGLANHPAWTLSHLAFASGFIAFLLGDPAAAPSPEHFKLYGPGSIPGADPAHFPAKSDALARLAQLHAAAAAAVRANHAEFFDRPTPEPFRSFSPTIGRLVTYLLAAHEPYHLGQLMQWRRAAGLAK